MNTRFAWFIAGATTTGILVSVAWQFADANRVVEPVHAGEDFYNAFAIHGPLESKWSRIHQLGDLDVWSDDGKSSLAITKNGRAVQLLTIDDGCCIFDIFESGEYKATVKYGNFDERLMSHGVDQNGIVWTYVDMGINGTVDFRFKDGISDSKQQVIMTQFAGDGENFRQVSNSGW